MFYTVVYLKVPSIMKSLLCNPTGEMNKMMCETFTHACIL